MSRKILPDVIIIGAMKAGTTNLYEYMAGHSQIGVSSEKETDFFVAGKNWSRGLDWYHNQFRPGYTVYAEASPNYTKRGLFAGVPERIAEVIPNCKFIFLARDPVKRAESQYRHVVLSGKKAPGIKELPGSRTLRNLVDSSSYAAQIEPYLALFPRKNFLFLQFEDLVHNPGKVLGDVAGFIGVNDEWPTGKDIATNSADSLARLPHWVFSLRETRFASVLKPRLSRIAISRLKSLVSRGVPPRQAEPFSPEIRETITQMLQDDQDRFLAILNRPS